MAKTNKQRRAENKELLARADWARTQYNKASGERVHAEQALDNARYREEQFQKLYEYLMDLAVKQGADR